MRRNLDLSPSQVHTPSAIVEDKGDTGRGTTIEKILSDSSNLRPAALCLVQNRRGEVLCVSRPEPPHEMSLPGGMVDDTDADSLQAAIRELREETGVEAWGPTARGNWKHLGDMKSPTDHRKVSVYRLTVDERRLRKARAAEAGTSVAWMEPRAMVRQAALYRSTLQRLMDDGAFEMSTPAERALARKTKREQTRSRPVPATQLQVADPDKKPANIHIRVDGLAHGGALSIRHMKDFFAASDNSWSIEKLKTGEFQLRDYRRLVSDSVHVEPKAAGVQLVGPEKWKDGTPVTLAWTKIAEVGKWLGHPAGEFEMTPATFAEIKKNHESRGLPLGADMEHFSELPTEQIDPRVGAPAHGWVHKFDNRGVEGLWGLVEWLDYAREGIKAGNFAFLSPAIRFDAVDTVSGKKIGARCTSIAITNSPFLTQLGQLRAAKLDGVGSSDQPLVMLGLAHHPNEYMPNVRASLGMHPTATAAECSDRLETLRGHYEADRDGDRDGHNEGIKLSDHLLPLRDFFGDASMGMTWEDLLDKMQDMIDASMDEHVETYHAGANMRLCKDSRTGTPELSLDDMRSLVQSAITKKYGSEKDRYDVWISDLYDSYAIYTKDGSNGRVAYTYKNGEANLVGDTEKVAREYVPMSDKNPPKENEMDLAQQLKDLQAKHDALEVQLKEFGSVLSPEGGVLLLKDSAEKPIDGFKRIVAEVVTLRADKVAGEKIVADAKTANEVLLRIVGAVSKVGGKDETPEAVVLRLVGDNETLKTEKDVLLSDKTKREMADEDRDCALALGWYRDKNAACNEAALVRGKDGKADGWMMSLRRTNPAGFNDAFPPLAPGQEHMLRLVTPPEQRPPPPEEKTTASFSGTLSLLMSEKGYDYASACSEATLIVRGTKKYADLASRK